MGMINSHGAWGLPVCRFWVGEWGLNFEPILGCYFGFDMNFVWFRIAMAAMVYGNLKPS
jgi:hypothetical protein